jgi:hypothetical protein
VRSKNTLILLAIAVVFAVYYFAIEQPRHQENLEAERQAYQLTELTLADIHYLTLDRAGETLEFSRSGDQWHLQAPVEDLAFRPSVNSLIASVVDARIERTLPAEGKDLQAYGLADRPAAVIQLATASRDTVLEVWLGDHTITKTHCYARQPDGDKILLLPSGLKSYALMELPMYRDDKLFRFQIESVIRFELAAAGRSSRWHLNEWSRWETAVEGDTIAGDHEQIEAVLRRLRGLRVRRFVTDDPAEAGQPFSDDSPVITMWFDGETDPESIRFEPLDRDSCYAKRDRHTRLVLTDNPILAEFGKTVDDLRDHQLLHFARAKIGRIRFQTADTTATIVKTSRHWAYDNPALGTIDPSLIEPILTALEDLKLTRVVAEEVVAGRYGFESPFMAITVLNDRAEVIDRLECGVETGGGRRFATSRSSGLLAEIEPDQLARIASAFRNLRTK